ncbi:MAG: ABC transporter ATP-binding protein [Fibrobacter sp.]|nr:ABC transporter ATP-binding protein [Fibrobacter sp.]
MSILLQSKELEFGYGKRFAAPMNFELQAGEVVALMGRNGSGKSTLLKTLSGKIPALGGSVEIGNQSLNTFPATELAKNIAYISISRAAPERMTVAEFVGLGRMPYSNFFDGRTKEDLRIVNDALALLQLESFADRNVCELSDGERSRVYLAQAVAQQVKILLLDEPNAFLDIPWSHQLFKTLCQLASDRGMGIIVSTHSMEYASKYCNRVMVVDCESVPCGSWLEAEQKGWLEWTK